MIAPLARCLAVAALLLSALPAAAQAPIRIGSFLALTGGASFVGDPEAKTLRLFVEDLNAKGGVLGRQIELVIRDSAGDPKAATAAAKRLIEEDKVDLIVGGSTTGETMAAVPLVQTAGVPLISLAAGAVIVEPVKKWVFKVPHSDRMAVAKSYADMKARGLTRIAIFGGIAAFDRSCLAEARKAAGRYGLRILAEETYANDAEVPSRLAKIKATRGVEAVFGCGFGPVTAATVKAYHEQGFAQPMYFNHSVASQGFLGAAGPAANGLRLPAAALIVADQLPEADPQKAPGVAYAQAYKARYGEPVTTFGGHAYDGLMIALGAIERAKSTEKSRVRTAIEQTRNHVGVDGIYNMTRVDHVGLDLASFKMIEVKDGRFVLMR